MPHTDPATDKARDLSNRMLTTKELIGVQQGFENCREAIGWDHDLMVHCHWEYDLRTSIQIADAVESCKPVWLEDPLPRRLFRFVEAVVRRRRRCRFAWAKTWRGAKGLKDSS